MRSTGVRSGKKDSSQGRLKLNDPLGTTGIEPVPTVAPMSSSQNTEVKSVPAVPKAEPFKSSQPRNSEPLVSEAELLKSSQPRNRELPKAKPEPLKSSEPRTPDNVVKISAQTRNHTKSGTTQKKTQPGTSKGKRRIVPNDEEREKIRIACMELLELGMKLKGKRGEVITQELLGKQAKLAKGKAGWWLNHRSQFEVKEAMA